jgi:hypothetical protein
VDEAEGETLVERVEREPHLEGEVDLHIYEVHLCDVRCQIHHKVLIFKDVKIDDVFVTQKNAFFNLPVNRVHLNLSVASHRI